MTHTKIHFLRLKLFCSVETTSISAKTSTKLLLLWSATKWGLVWHLILLLFSASDLLHIPEWLMHRVESRHDSGTTDGWCNVMTEHRLQLLYFPMKTVFGIHRSALDKYINPIKLKLRICSPWFWWMYEITAYMIPITAQLRAEHV